MGLAHNLYTAILNRTNIEDVFKHIPSSSQEIGEV
jgi:hypothetical protein